LMCPIGNTPDFVFCLFCPFFFLNHHFHFHTRCRHLDGVPDSDGSVGGSRSTAGLASGVKSNHRMHLPSLVLLLVFPPSL
jgi:hypothetical protein